MKNDPKMTLKVIKPLKYMAYYPTKIADQNDLKNT